MDNLYIQNLIDTDPQLRAILALPDEQFDKAYERVKDVLLQSFDNSEVQATARNAAASNQVTSREEGEKLLEEMISDIRGIEEYSEKKKEFLIDLVTHSANLTMDMIENPRERIKVKIFRLRPEAQLPTYAHPTDAGADISAAETVTIPAGETMIVSTGLAVAIPAGYEIQIRPRSGLSYKTKLRIANAPATIDSEYRGDIGIIVTNTGDVPYVIETGMKIAQMLIAPTPMIKWVEVDSEVDLGTTNRGSGGFGSTDAKS